MSLQELWKRLVLTTLIAIIHFVVVLVFVNSGLAWAQIPLTVVTTWLVLMVWKII